MGLSGVIPANYLTTDAFQALSPAQQAAATGAQALASNRQSLINSLLGIPSSVYGTNYTGIGVQPTAGYSTPAEAASAAALQSQQQSRLNLLTSYGTSGTIGGYAPTTFTQLILLQSLIRNGVAGAKNIVGNLAGGGSASSASSASSTAATSVSEAVAEGEAGEAAESQSPRLHALRHRRFVAPIGPGRAAALLRLEPLREERAGVVPLGGGKPAERGSLDFSQRDQGDLRRGVHPEGEPAPGAVGDDEAAVPLCVDPGPIAEGQGTEPRFPV